MVRDNWQTKAEAAETRRAAAKQRKLKRDSRATFKALATEFLTLLSRRKLSSASPFSTIHVWTDTKPSDAPPIPGLETDEDPRQRRKSRAGSFVNESVGSPITPKQQSRKSSCKGSKANPRRRESFDAAEESDPVTSPRLCRSQFYKGRCDDQKHGGKKTASCRFIHYTKKEYKTLSDVLGKEQVTLLGAVDMALAKADFAEEAVADDGMEMLYYFGIDLTRLKGNNGEESGSLGQILSRALNDKSCGSGSVVYVAIDNLLLYDRYQEGVQNQETLTGERSRSSSVTSEASRGSDEIDGLFDTDHAESMPAAVLEYILTFLPDSCVASMSQVCRSWNEEIGCTSPALWRHLLQRRNWPIPCISSSSKSAVDVMKSAFLMHYEVLRDISAINKAVSCLVNPRSSSKIEEIEMVYQNFSVRRFSPAAPNSCISIKVWSGDKILAAYSHDCSVRLYKAVETDTGGRACRELSSVCVDPYRKTRRQNATLVAMEIDSEMIGCLLHVQQEACNERDRNEKYILSVISRDDYLVAGGSNARDSLGWSEVEEGKLHIIDISEAVVNYLVSMDEVDDNLLRLLDYLAMSGEMEDIEVLISQSLVACGYGRFMVEATVSIPDMHRAHVEDEDDDGNAVMVTLARKYVIFASSLGAIVWMGDSSPSHDIPRSGDLVIRGILHPVGFGDARLSCTVVASSSVSPAISLTEIDPDGQIMGIRQVEAAEVAREELLQNESWNIDTLKRRPVVLSPSDVVAADVLYQYQGNGVHRCRNFKSIISFYPRFSFGNEVTYQTVVLEHFNVLLMETLRDEHVLLIGEDIVTLSNGRTSPTASHRNVVTLADNDAEEEEAELDVLVGRRWFDAPTRTGVLAVNALILHVPTRQVIERIRFPYDAGLHDLIRQTPMAMTSSGDLVGFGLAWKGIVMTGSSVRAVGSCGNKVEGTSPSVNTGKRKKKARQPNRGGKKDGFARGMSMRG